MLRSLVGSEMCIRDRNKGKEQHSTLLHFAAYLKIRYTTTAYNIYEYMYETLHALIDLFLKFLDMENNLKLKCNIITNIQY